MEWDANRGDVVVVDAAAVVVGDAAAVVVEDLESHFVARDFSLPWNVDEAFDDEEFRCCYYCYCCCCDCYG